MSHGAEKPKMDIYARTTLLFQLKMEGRRLGLEKNLKKIA